MKTSIIALMLAAVCSNAVAQDRGGRQRQPPGTGTNQGGGNRGGTGTGNSGGTNNGGTNNGGANNGGTHRDDRNDQPQNGGGRDNSSSNNGGARRRAPQLDGGALDAVRGARTNPGSAPTHGPDGSSLGHAVRRDSLPPASGFGDLDPRGMNEYERSRYYWHTHRGSSWCHYVDGYGDHWYYWYYGNDYYTMRYIDGRWWRYDNGYSRWYWLHDNAWYYQQGSTVYGSDETSGSSSSYDDGGSTAAEYVPPKVAVTVNLGHFGLNSGGEGSVINENQKFLNFDGAMSGISAAAEVNVGLGKYAEAGLGVGYQSATSGSQYKDYVSEFGTEIRQQTTMRNVPMNLNVKLMPFGRDKQIQPYVGAGVQLNKWSYEESGQFIDFNTQNYDVYRGTYKADGLAVGPTAIAGLRIPLNRQISLNAEYRHQWAKGELPASEGFAGDKIDLGGNTFQAGVTINLK